MTRRQPIVVRQPSQLRSWLPEIQRLADSDKEALGFLPAKAYEDAIGKQRLLAAISSDGECEALVGFILFSGVYPNAKIQQVVVSQQFRNDGSASLLMRSLVAELERLGFTSLRADVAADLHVALRFYAKHGFEPVFERMGGLSRGRKIIVHSKLLDSDNLFTRNEVSKAAMGPGSLRAANRKSVPTIALDLNVYLDLVKNREHSEGARRLFGEALGHIIRLVVSAEFADELRRTTTSEMYDPVLQLALQLPRLPSHPSQDLNALTSEIHKLVFESTGSPESGTPQAFSDARHLAHAALCRVTAFVTRDKTILRSRTALLERYGLDIATLDEITDLLPDNRSSNVVKDARGDGFSVAAISEQEFLSYCSEVRIAESSIASFASVLGVDSSLSRIGVFCEQRLIAVASLCLPRSLGRKGRVIVHVMNEYAVAELVADFLLDTAIREASARATTVIELCRVPGQTILNGLARLKGFYRDFENNTYTKVAVGRPISRFNWDEISNQVRRQTGFVLPQKFSSLQMNREIEVGRPDGVATKTRILDLENAFGPTVVVCKGRDGVLVPIARRYADDLLGTSDQGQLAFVEKKDATFLTLRGYVNSPNKAAFFVPNAPIIFYESKRTGGGRGAAVAIGRIVNSFVVTKALVRDSDSRRLVVEALDDFSTSEDVLITTFDNLMPFPKIVPLRRLKELDCIGRANLISAVPINSAKIDKVLSYAW